MEGIWAVGYIVGAAVAMATVPRSEEPAVIVKIERNWIVPGLAATVNFPERPCSMSNSYQHLGSQRKIKI